MRQYYIPYDESIDINYIYVLLFYSIAEYDKKKWRYDFIKYRTQNELLDRLNQVFPNKDKKISISTLRRILDNKDYSHIFSVDKVEKTITINNDISKCKKFVVISQKEVDLILRENDILLAKYILYLKYFCGYSKSKSIDTTIQQFLAATGYSTKSNNYVSMVSAFNGILVREGIINIYKERDCNGYERNIYSFT